jgi:hypothetical protein
MSARTRRCLLMIAIVMMATAPAAPVQADPTGTCPDQFVLLYSPGSKKDKNGNGFICQKFNNQGELAGGPDDKMDDVIL